METVTGNELGEDGQQGEKPEKADKSEKSGKAENSEKHAPAVAVHISVKDEMLTVRAEERIVAAFPVTVPPLRERPGDIPLLARHFLRVSAQRNNLTMPTLSERVVADLQGRPWKGNVRELENVMERAILVAGGASVDIHHLLPGDGTILVRENEPPIESILPPSTHGSLWEMERDLIFKTLARVKENRTHAAKELGISIRTLRNKLREYRGMGYPVEADKS
jgi:two-component system response regulator FlrC